MNRLEEILIDSGFSDGAPIPDELNSLVVVMLFELTQRRFIIRGTRSKAALGPRMEEVEEVERHLDKVNFLFSKIFNSIWFSVRCKTGSITCSTPYP